MLCPSSYGRGVPLGDIVRRAGFARPRGPIFLTTVSGEQSPAKLSEES